MDLQAACRAASEAVAQIDARTKTKLVKRALEHGMTEAEGIELVKAFKRAARHTKRLPWPKASRDASLFLDQFGALKKAATGDAPRLV